uniref:Uncharacterized protein n=1 Tax=Romanomermis culicivorax TaxID=13658 RepID=A0A915IQG2_ROMCU
MELPSPMKVDDDITTNKLIIDKNVVETPEPEMVESKELTPVKKKLTCEMWPPSGGESIQRAPLIYDSVMIALLTHTRNIEVDFLISSKVVFCRNSDCCVDHPKRITYSKIYIFVFDCNRKRYNLAMYSAFFYWRKV